MDPKGVAVRDTVEFWALPRIDQDEAVDAEDLCQPVATGRRAGVPGGVEGHGLPAIPLGRSPVHVADRARVGDPSTQHAPAISRWTVCTSDRWGHGVDEQVD